MATSVNDVSYVLWGLYCLPFVLIVLLARPSAALTAGPFPVKRVLTQCAAAAIIGFVLGLLSGPGAFWLCNCGSSQVFGGGNNHFDQDVAVGNMFSLALLMPCYVHAYWYKRIRSSPYVLGAHALMVAWVLLLLWSSAIGWTPPGCDQSLWR